MLWGVHVKQECRLWNVWIAWVAMPGFALVMSLLGRWQVGVLVLVVGIAFQLAYVRWFPHLSRWLGYGSVADVPAQTTARVAVPTQVTLYTARGCPFCPIMRQRLSQLQGELGFKMVEHDVTFRPGLVAAKGLQSVPVIEAHGEYLVGNATSAELLGFLSKAKG